MNEIHETNRARWNEWANWWAKRADERGLWKRCHRDPNLALSPGEMRFLADVRDLRVCVLGSGDNEVVFALAGLGAEVTSVDISEEQLKIAEARAHTLGLEITFVRADVTDLKDLEDENFDVAYTGGHVSIWVSDIRRYYAEAVRILKVGGLFVVNEYHPFRRIWDEEAEGMVSRYPYFGSGPVEHWDDEGRLGIEFHWTVADHIQSILDAGCPLIAVEEYGEGQDDWRKADLSGLPEFILMVGRK